MYVGGGEIYFITNLELLAPPFAQALDSAHTLSSTLQCWTRPNFFVFQIKSPRTPVVQDLELGALPEEAAGGDEDREKEILMERIQSIKEETGE